MAIKIDKNQPKTIKMGVSIQGIDRNKLNFHFRINLNEMTIGFVPKMIDEYNLEVYIPPLSSLICDLDQGRYLSCLEINDGEKYYLKPWKGEIVIEEEPQVTATIDEYEELSGSTLNVNYVNESQDLRDNDKKEKKPNKKYKKKKMTKEEAAKFVKEARKKLANEDEKIVNKFIKETLNKHGYDYNPPSKSTKSKSKKDKGIKIESRDDIIKFLKQNGMKSERVLSTLMETIDNRSGGDIEAMYDIASRMVNPNHEQFNDSNDIYNFFQNQQMSNMNMPQNINEDQLTSGDNSSNTNLMEQIQKAKSDLYNQMK